MKYFVFSMLCLGSLSGIRAQNPTYPPRDESLNDVSLQAFVAQLEKAIQDRDQKFLYTALDLDVERGVSAGDILRDFKTEWDTDNDSSAFWLQLDRVLQMGGVFLHDTADMTGRYQFVFPYVYDMPLDIEDDYYSIGVITGKKVNLREGPKTASPVRVQLTYDVVWYLQEEQYGKTQSGTSPLGGTEWFMVETYDRQQRGWVNWRYVYSPMDFRVFLYKNKQGTWRISNILAGD